jgi:hypothetical protein
MTEVKLARTTDLYTALPVSIPLSLDGDLTCDWPDGDTW